MWASKRRSVSVPFSKENPDIDAGQPDHFKWAHINAPLHTQAHTHFTNSHTSTNTNTHTHTLTPPVLQYTRPHTFTHTSSTEIIIFRVKDGKEILQIVYRSRAWNLIVDVDHHAKIYCR